MKKTKKNIMKQVSRNIGLVLLALGPAVPGIGTIIQQYRLGIPLFPNREQMKTVREDLFSYTYYDVNGDGNWDYKSSNLQGTYKGILPKLFEKIN